MKRKELLKKLADFFDQDLRKQQKHRKQLKQLLKRLRDKEQKLHDKLDKENDPDKAKRLEKELDVVHAQRLKGLTKLKELKTL